MKQYEIWWADLPKPAGRWPVLLLSRDDSYGFLHKFLAAEITTTIRLIPAEVRLRKGEGMPKPCVMNCDNLRTISRVHLEKRISTIPTRRIPELKRAVGYAPGWEELIQTGE